MQQHVNSVSAQLAAIVTTSADIQTAVDGVMSGQLDGVSGQLHGIGTPIEAINQDMQQAVDGTIQLLSIMQQQAADRTREHVVRSVFSALCHGLRHVSVS